MEGFFFSGNRVEVGLVNVLFVISKVTAVHFINKGYSTILYKQKIKFLHHSKCTASALPKPTF